MKVNGWKELYIHTFLNYSALDRVKSKQVRNINIVQKFCNFPPKAINIQGQIIPNVLLSCTFIDMYYK